MKHSLCSSCVEKKEMKIIIFYYMFLSIISLYDRIFNIDDFLYIMLIKYYKKNELLMYVIIVIIIINYNLLFQNILQKVKLKFHIFILDYRQSKPIMAIPSMDLMNATCRQSNKPILSLRWPIFQ